VVAAMAAAAKVEEQAVPKVVAQAVVRMVV